MPAAKRSAAADVAPHSLHVRQRVARRPNSTSRAGSRQPRLAPVLRDLAPIERRARRWSHGCAAAGGGARRSAARDREKSYLVPDFNGLPEMPRATPSCIRWSVGAGARRVRVLRRGDGAQLRRRPACDRVRAQLRRHASLRGGVCLPPPPTVPLYRRLLHAARITLAIPAGSLQRSSATPSSTRALAFREPVTAHVSGCQRNGMRPASGATARGKVGRGRAPKPTRLVNRITPPDHTLAAYCDRRGTGIPPLVAVSYSEARRFVGSDEVCGIGVIKPCWVRRLRLRLVRPCSGNQFTSVSSIRAFALSTLESLAERPSSGSPWP
jgi:hypothetical protein